MGCKTPILTFDQIYRSCKDLNITLQSNLIIYLVVKEDINLTCTEEYGHDLLGRNPNLGTKVQTVVLHKNFIEKTVLNH